MSPTQDQSSRLSYTLAQQTAAVLIAGTNILPLHTGSILSDPWTTYSYQQILNNPFSAATNEIGFGFLDETANSVTRIPPEKAIGRWFKYVARRLSAFRAGVGDFTGLRIPTPWVINRAWLVAENYFLPDTPPPSVVPTEDGDVLFIWHKAGWELQIEAGSEGVTAWARNRRSGETWSGSLDARQAELHGLFHLFGQN